METLEDKNNKLIRLLMIEYIYLNDLTDNSKSELIKTELNNNVLTDDYRFQKVLKNLQRRLF